uniref:Uncharacterized protein n=1 Tax=Arundo donax TaxID=35708 RepID=A0A0A9EZI3_ARUDO
MTVLTFSLLQNTMFLLQMWSIALCSIPDNNFSFHFWRALHETELLGVHPNKC